MWYNQNPWMTEKEFYEKLEKEKNSTKTEISINTKGIFAKGDAVTSLPPQTCIIHLCPKEEAKKREIQRNRMVSVQNTKIKLIISTKKKYVKFVLPDEKEIKVKCHKDDKFDWKIGLAQNYKFLTLDELKDTAIKTYLSATKARASFLQSWWSAEKEDFDNGTYKVIPVNESIIEVEENENR